MNSQYNTVLITVPVDPNQQDTSFTVCTSAEQQVSRSSCLEEHFVHCRSTSQETISSKTYFKKDFDITSVDTMLQISLKALIFQKRWQNKKLCGSRWTQALT